MLPRPGWPHDQLLRATVVAGIGGLIIGHIAWLVGISFVIATTAVERWVLIQSAVIGLVSALSLLAGWLLYRRRSHVLGAFLLWLPISPVVLTVCLLGVMYL